MNKNIFESESDPTVLVEQRTLEQAVGSILHSFEFPWRNYFGPSKSLITLVTEMSGNAGDTIDGWVEFDYNNDEGSLSWKTEAIKIFDGVVANRGIAINRIDILENFRRHIPFETLRVKFKKASGENDTCPIKGKLLIVL